MPHYLAKYQREEFHRFLRDTSRLGPLASTGHIVPPGVIPENVRLFKDRFGEDLAELVAYAVSRGVRRVCRIGGGHSLSASDPQRRERQQHERKQRGHP